MYPFARPPHAWAALSVLAFIAVTTAPSRAVIRGVDDAGDVCPASADPCVIGEPVEVVSGSRLDFGVRTVRIVSGGQLVVKAGSVEVACGAFQAVTPGAVAVLARGPVAGGGQDGGTLVLESRGTCSANRFIPCFFDGQCGVGPCVGTACASASQASCSVDADCELGACRPGDGVDLRGGIEAQGVLAGVLSITAAGPVSIADVVDLDSTDTNSDGGQLEVMSVLGAISVSGRVEATSGRLGFGGIVTLSAGTDVTVTGVVDASGGDFDGGELDIVAQRDIRVSGELRANAKGGEGAGGFVTLDARNDLRLLAPAKLSANGHRSAENFGGDGGAITLAAGRDLTVQAGATAEADGAKPDGFAGDIDLVAEGDVVVAGKLAVRALGTQGGGGGIDVSGCNIEVTAAGTVESIGGEGDTVFTARTSMVSQPGSKILANKNTGTNLVFYRDAARPPSLKGTVEPAAMLQLAPGLDECIRCGNGIVEAGESCDDENVVGGDGCSSECQEEMCLADTPGYPEQPLCDDGNVCTDDTCSSGTGCSHLANTVECEDGLGCTVADACRGGRCRGESTCGAGQFCSRTSGACAPGSTTTTSTLPGVCGDAVVGAGEDCDDGDTIFVRGDSCTARCIWTACADPDDSGSITASDALIILRVAVGLEGCQPCVCDVDASSGAPSASDALRTLRAAVGLPVGLQCPSCS